MKTLKPLATLAVAGLMFALASCASTSPDSQYPDDVRANFMEACVAQSGATEASCGDCLVALENEYTFDEFVALDAAMREGTVEPAEQERFDAIVAECGE